MILSFLRLFPQFAACESDLAECRTALAELSTEKLMLQDRLDAALADKEHLWRSMNEALANERNSLRMQVNHAVQKAGGGVPYPDAHSLPAGATQPIQESGPVGRRGRLLSSEAVQQQSRKFIAAFVEDLNQRAVKSHG